jgi:hypothetical protein
MPAPIRHRFSLLAGAVGNVLRRNDSTTTLATLHRDMSIQPMSVQGHDRPFTTALRHGRTTLKRTTSRKGDQTPEQYVSYPSATYREQGEVATPALYQLQTRAMQ